MGITSGEICAERGGLHMIRLHENPRQPEFSGGYFEEVAGGITRNGYIHDTQCVIYRGSDRAFHGRELFENDLYHNRRVSERPFYTAGGSLSRG